MARHILRAVANAVMLSSVAALVSSAPFVSAVCVMSADDPIKQR